MRLGEESDVRDTALLHELDIAIGAVTAMMLIFEMLDVAQAVGEPHDEEVLASIPMRDGGTSEIVGTAVSRIEKNDDHVMPPCRRQQSHGSW